LLKQEEEGDAAVQGRAPDLPGMPGTVQSEREVPGGKIQRVKVPLPGFDGDGGQVDPQGQPSISVRPIEIQEQQPETVDQAEPADAEGSTPESEDADAAGNEQTGG
jgi:hypothetical protein